MALQYGINCGLVLRAPTADPEGSQTVPLDTYARGLKVTPTAKIIVSQIGWFSDDATSEANFEVGIYSHDSVNNVPANLLNSNTTNAKGTDSGWKTVSGLNWELQGGVTYWICVQLDNTTNNTFLDRDDVNGYDYAYYSGPTALEDPWGDTTNQEDALISIYALYTEKPATIGQKELKTHWPVEEGITDAFNQSQIGRISNLIPEKSFIPQRLKRGL